VTFSQLIIILLSVSIVLGAEPKCNGNEGHSQIFWDTLIDGYGFNNFSQFNQSYKNNPDLQLSVPLKGVTQSVRGAFGGSSYHTA